MKKFGEPNMVNNLLIGYSTKRQLTKLHLKLAAIAFLLLALAGPKIIASQLRTETVGANVIFVLDVSLSMLAEDIPPNRLEKAKYIVSKAVNELTKSQIAIVVYSGIAYPLVPFTSDHESIKNALHGVNTNMLPIPGSSLKEAIEMAIRFKAKKNFGSNYIFLLSDGEDHLTIPNAILDSTVNKGFKIFTLGLGTLSGSPIPVRQANGRSVLKKDQDGKIVYTSLKDQSLKLLASKTGGQYKSILHTIDGVNFITTAVKEIESTYAASNTFRHYQSLFQWLLGLALVLLLIEIIISEGKYKLHQS
ncbi:BatB protein [Adhaeribacter aerolatus]|uniref:BatB protein n=2 Tax=Adhaeribacter aerolatus TaxID=670289 RepID=A0A512AWQ7_9BACT|nr:BatB protein [Adhaeribacter aerolatus]